MDRSKARACAVKLVYEWDMGGDGGEDTLINLLEIQPDEREADFMTSLFDGVRGHRDELDQLIAEHLREGWSLERIARVDHAILLVAVYELRYTDLKDSIVINEAIEVAKEYSTDKAASFINGVLGSISRAKANV